MLILTIAPTIIMVNDKSALLKRSPKSRNRSFAEFAKQAKHTNSFILRIYQVGCTYVGLK